MPILTCVAARLTPIGIIRSRQLDAAHTDAAAVDLARLVRHYLAAWHTSRVLLVGYSFGADVLPFLVNRLPVDVATRVHSVVLLGPSESATFAFHVSDWVRTRATDFRTGPEVARLKTPVVCVRGADEDDSSCGALHGPHVTTVRVGHGHHFGGDYTRLADVIVDASR